MRIAVLGGTFNPLHIGHLALADEVCTSLGYDRLLFVPAFRPPHKEMADSISAKDRLEMVRLACGDDERFMAESCEIDRGGVSYTFDTICYLEKKYAGQIDGKIGLVMGDDLIPGFPLWYRAEELSQKCDLILALRPQVESSSGHENSHSGGYGSVPHATRDSSGKVIFDVSANPLFRNALSVKNPELVLRSTEIRTRISEGRAFRYLVPSAVFGYIIERRLYGSDRQRDL